VTRRPTLARGKHCGIRWFERERRLDPELTDRQALRWPIADRAVAYAIAGEVYASRRVNGIVAVSTVAPLTGVR
jgi:hypothetical protein